MTHSQKILAPLDHIPAEITCARDYERFATHFIPPDRLAYIAGGSGQDQTVQNNQRIFSDYAITPRVLSDLSAGHTHCDLLGRLAPHPILLAPVAYQKLVHPGAERETVHAAEATDTCVVASTLSSLSLEEMAHNSDAQRWFQLYFQPQRQHTEHLISRAVRAGYTALVVTVDASIQRPSIRALRAGFRFPADITPANLEPYGQSNPVSHQNTFEHYMQNAVQWRDIQWLVDHSPLPIIVKGVMSPDDALKLQDLGIAGIVVSNHGGRTVDGVPASLAALSAVRSAVGTQFPLLFDSGIRSGEEIFKAIALGADAVMIGRLQLYALSIAGALGVAHLIKILREELELAMAVAGCSSLEDIKSTQLFRYTQG